MDKISVWEAVLERLSEKISRMEFHTWFKKVQISEISGSAIVLSCPTEMNKNWLESKYHSVILSNIKVILPEIDSLYFKVDLSLADSKSVEALIFREKNKSPRKLPNQPHSRIEKNLDTRITQSKYRLENFIAGDTNKFAHTACLTVAETKITDKKKYNPLFVYGGVGLGKTHLLQAIYNKIIHNQPEAKIVYVTGERFLTEIVDAIKKRNLENFRKKYRRVDVFILDDVQFFEGKEKTQEELFNTFNDLYEFSKQIVFSADRPPSTLLGISDRLRSRLGWGLMVDVQMPDISTREKIIREKSTEMKLFLPDEIVKFIADNIRSNLRELENVLNQISAEIEISEVSPTVQSVGRIFRKMNPEEKIVLDEDGKTKLARTTDDIITLVCDYFQVPATELIGLTRKAEVVYPRQIAWLLCKSILHKSYEAIGADFGGKNHTTIMHGIRKITVLSRKDSQTARHIHALKKDLGVR